jgi:hypothetical protein
VRGRAYRPVGWVYLPVDGVDSSTEREAIMMGYIRIELLRNDGKIMRQMRRRGREVAKNSKPRSGRGTAEEIYICDRLEVSRRMTNAVKP